MPSTLFIADLHLCKERPQINAAFFAFIDAHAARANTLYILGDLFEAWVGDDDLADTLHTEVTHALHQLTNAGVAVFVMHGNRDFLLAEAFCKASGATLIADPTVITLGGIQTLLMHGDTLCSDDVSYLAFRQQARDPAWQCAFLDKPLTERHSLAQALRAQSETTKADKTPEIMDVNAAAVTAALHAHGCTRLIHGHTHRPAQHALNNGAERWVLPAWYNGAGWLQCIDEEVPSKHSGCQLHLP